MKFTKVALFLESEWIIWALLALNLLFIVFFSFEVSLFSPVNHMDGSFQTADGLFHLADGDIPGRDFLPYLGIAPYLLIFPVFLLAGSNLAASVFSAQLVTLIALQVSTATLVILFARRKALLWGMISASTIPILLELERRLPDQMVSIPGSKFFLDFLDPTSPGNSLRPIRFFAPYFLAFIAYLIIQRKSNGRFKLELIAFFAGGVGALWSNDFALVSGVGMLVILWIRGLWDRKYKAIPRTLISWLIGFFGLGFLATAGSFFDYMKYNFSDVRNDQYWYFGPWDRAGRIYSFHDLVSVILRESGIAPTVLLVCLALFALFKKDFNYLLLAYIGGVLILGGAAASIGGHVINYFSSFRWWGLLTLVLLVVRVISLLAGKIVHKQKRTLLLVKSTLLPIFVSVALVLSLWATINALKSESLQRTAANSNSQLYYEAKLGGFIDSKYKNYLDLASTTNGVVEEYSGLLGAIQHPTSLKKTDSIIAALGQQRASFENVIAKSPKMVVTTNPGFRPDWTTWNISANWWFYKYLFKNYSAQESTPTTMLWTLAEPSPWPETTCEIAPNGQAILLDAPNAGLYEVTLKYLTQGRSTRTFTMVDNGISFPFASGGFLALDPGAKAQSFPVSVSVAGQITLATRDSQRLNTGPFTHFLDCSASEIVFPANSSTFELYAPLLLPASSPYNTTDDNWKAGVGRSFTGFFVLNTVSNQKAFANATAIEFSDGSIRKITGNNYTYFHINLYLEGKKLDPKLYGYPNQFTILTN